MRADEEEERALLHDTEYFTLIHAWSFFSLIQQKVNFSDSLISSFIFTFLIYWVLVASRERGINKNIF